MKPVYRLLMLMLLSFACCIASCSNSKQQEVLNRAEALMEAHPDSAFSLLKVIEGSELISRTEQARYALLMSMALDKNYIDTTTFDVLQPAIDYYLKMGTPNEQLRTYYYQGRIYQNNGNKDRALNSFVRGTDLISTCTDSLLIARTLVAQACLYYELYDITSYANNYQAAANIYKRLANKDLEFDCLLNAMNGAILLGNSRRADSLIDVCNKLNPLDIQQCHELQEHLLSYAITFGNKPDIQAQLHLQGDTLDLSTNSLLTRAYAHNRLGNNHQTIQILTHIAASGMPYDTLKYQSILVSTLEAVGDYKAALSAYKNFSNRLDSINALKFGQKAQSIIDRHNIELKAQQDARTKSMVIASCIAGIIVLAIGVVILLLLIRSNRIQRNLAHQRARNAELEKDKLKAERDKKALEAENLAHRVDMLENESTNLKSLLSTPNDLPPEVRTVIKVRIEMLNALLASHITTNNQYEKAYDTWVKQLTDDTEAFMNTNRLAFQASHPRFIQYFQDHNLSINEINYVCLYAIGLRGKEVGDFLKKRSHVNTSSAIRKKLGIDKHETNIGIYVRRLLKSL